MTYIMRGNQAINTARSGEQNIDNGAGTTEDHVILRHSRPIRLLSAKVVYSVETTGTVAAANVKLGTTVGGTDIVAATALGNTKAVGTVLALTLAKTNIPANTPIMMRHTGVATTAAGSYYVELEYEIVS